MKDYYCDFIFFINSWKNSLLWNKQTNVSPWGSADRGLDPVSSSWIECIWFCEQIHASEKKKEDIRMFDQQGFVPDLGSLKNIPPTTRPLTEGNYPFAQYKTTINVINSKRIW